MDSLFGSDPLEENLRGEEITSEINLAAEPGDDIVMAREDNPEPPRENEVA
jgi:hypothetical protein